MLDVDDLISLLCVLNENQLKILARLVDLLTRNRADVAFNEFALTGRQFRDALREQHDRNVVARRAWPNQGDEERYVCVRRRRQFIQEFN